jgi:DMSO/TMAO reductase YedYZ molybdopterin-dependent catalytic subunit
MDPKADPKTKNSQLRLVVIVEARDGYTVAFSLAELLADVGNRPVWLSLELDGQPLSERDGPIRLIVPEDQKPARWVHSVKSISMVDESRPTTRPAD